MTFCGNCGAQLKGDERFCVACGAAVPAKGTEANGATAPVAAPVAAAVAAPVAAPAAMAPAPPPVPYAQAAPVAYAQPAGYAAPPGTVPVVVNMPAAANHGGKVWVVVAIVALLAGSYFYSKHKQAVAAANAAAAAAANAAELKDQWITGNWESVYGYVQVRNAAWTNRSAKVMQSATLECDQYAADGSDLMQMHTNLNGPVNPGATATFNPFQMGAVTMHMTRVNCFISAVVPAS